MLVEFISIKLVACRVPLVLLNHLANPSHWSSAINHSEEACLYFVSPRIGLLWIKLFIEYKLVSPHVAFDAES